MHFLFGSLFWGVILILFGLSMVLKAFFKIDIPIFRIVFAIIIIYWGLKLLFGGFGFSHHENTVIFNNAKIKATKSHSEYNVIFGRSDIDLTNIDISEKNVRSEVNVIFGSGLIYLDPSIPTVVKISTVFAESKLPDRTVSFFGDYVYRNAAYVEGEDCLILNVDVVFGNVRFEEK